jgi:large subunit ribosomal protein L13
VERRWYVVDADGAVLGRLASEVAKLLRGKNKPIFAPHADTGDHVVVVNARGVVLSGSKRETKQYHHHSGYPGGLRSVDYARLLEQRPSLAVEKAVKGMLPKNRLGRKMFAKLSVYDGAEHPHAAQKPSPLALGEMPRWEGLPKHEEAPPAAAPEKDDAPKTRTRAQRAPAGEAPRDRGKAPAKRASASSAKGAAASTSTTGSRSKASTRTRASGGSASAKKEQAPSGAKPASKESAAAGEEKKAPASTRRAKEDEEES